MDNNSLQVHLVSQELQLTRVLAGNNKAAREKALRNLKKWFAKRMETTTLTEHDFQRIWKGLFYAMWMADKPLVQEECAENIASLIHFPKLDTSMLFFKAGLIILNNEWQGIDQLRLDKFMMLVRRLLRQAFVVLKNHTFTKKNIENFNNVLSSSILSPTSMPSLGLLMHFIETFMEELAKVSEGKIPQDRLLYLVQPFIIKLVTSKDDRIIGHIKKFIFTYLIDQTDEAFEYQEKYEAWKQLGFPGTIDSMQKIPLEDDEKMSSGDDDEQSTEGNLTNKPLDPRAGRVDVEIPQLKFDAKALASALLNHKFDKNSTTAGRKTITSLATQFKRLAKGEYPLGIKKVIDEKDTVYEDIHEAANRLIKFEQKIMEKDRKRKRVKDSNEPQEVASKRTKKERKGSEDAENIDSQSRKKMKRQSNRIIETSLQNVEGDVRKRIKKENKKKTQTVKGMNKLRSMKEVLKGQPVDNVECVFERNSGTWIVFDVTDTEQSEKIPSIQSGDTVKGIRKVDIMTETPSLCSKKLNGTITIEPSQPGSPPETAVKRTKIRGKNRTARNSTEDNQPAADQTSLDDVGIESEIKKQIYSYLCETIKTEPSLLGLMGPAIASPNTRLRKTRSFPVSEWDKPLEEGEYELFVPSKKVTRKRSKEQMNTEHQTMLNTTLNSISRKTKSVVASTFSTPGSSKKVKINTKLNTSQEIDEHLSQVKSSPGIPFDASKRPLKPLLKSPINMSPINPFYKRKGV